MLIVVAGGVVVEDASSTAAPAVVAGAGGASSEAGHPAEQVLISGGAGAESGTAAAVTVVVVGAGAAWNSRVVAGARDGSGAALQTMAAGAAKTPSATSAVQPMVVGDFIASATMVVDAREVGASATAASVVVAGAGVVNAGGSTAAAGSNVAVTGCGPGRAVLGAGVEAKRSVTGENIETSVAARSSKMGSPAAAATSCPAPAAPNGSGTLISREDWDAVSCTGHETSPRAESSHPVAGGPSRECTGIRWALSEGAGSLTASGAGEGEEVELCRRCCLRRW